MTYQQVSDVVATMRQAHQRLRDLLEEPQMQTDDPRTRLMLEALRREEQSLQAVLAPWQADGHAPVLDTWLQFVPDEDLREAVSSIEFTPDMSAENVVVRKLEFDQALIDLLRQLTEETSVPRVQEFFRSLLEHAESRASQEAWSIREYQAAENPPKSDL